MRIRLRLVVAPAVVALGALALAAGSSAANHVVHNGQSIQAAIDAASPGDRILVEPGTYNENLTIAKDHITLKALGKPGSVTLTPGTTPTPSVCITDPSAIPGICVTGQMNPDGSPGTPVTGTRIVGFVVDGFSDFGVVLFNANDSAVLDTTALNNKSYGISGFVLSGIRFKRDVAHDNGEPGFYIGDSPNAHAAVFDNVSYHNGVGGAEGDGFLFRDSSFGGVRGNKAWDNCVGFIWVDTGQNPAPTSNWRASHNEALHNNGACAGEQGGPPALSGLGFVLFGTHHVALWDNDASGNVASGPSLFSGGIVVASSLGVGGADPTDNRVIDNDAHGNSPFDILWDGSGSGNTFRANECGTSMPSWICS